MRLIDYGKITKIAGAQGWLKIVPFSGDARALESVGRIFLKVGASPEVFRITEKSVRAKGALIKLAGVSSPEEAEKLRGKAVMVAPSDLPKTSEGEYYNFQLEGLSVISGGVKIGTVQSILQSGSQSVFVVSKTAGGELLVPMAEKFVARIDIENGKVTLKNAEGLDA